MAIVRVDFGETVFAGANQVQRISGTQIDGRKKRPVGTSNLFQQAVGQWEKLPQPLLHIAVKFRVENNCLIRGEGTLTQLTVEYGIHFGQR